jgi:hypothetical protein
MRSSSTLPVVQDKEQPPHTKPAHHADVPPHPAEMGSAIKHEGAITTMTTMKRKRTIWSTREVAVGEGHRGVVRRTTAMTKKSRKRRTGDRRRRRLHRGPRARGRRSSLSQAMKTRTDSEIRHSTGKWSINDSADIDNIDWSHQKIIVVQLYSASMKTLMLFLGAVTTKRLQSTPEKLQSRRATS